MGCGPIFLSRNDGGGVIGETMQLRRPSIAIATEYVAGAESNCSGFEESEGNARSLIPTKPEECDARICVDGRIFSNGC